MCTRDRFRLECYSPGQVLTSVTAAEVVPAEPTAPRSPAIERSGKRERCWRTKYARDSGATVEGDVLWSRRLADELWSGVVTPLTFSLLCDVMSEHLVRRRLVRAGLERHSHQPVFRLVRGRVFVNASLVAEVMQELPTPTISDGLLALVPEALRDGIRRQARPALSPAVLATILHLTWAERGWMPWSRAQVFRDEAERVARDLRQPEAASTLSSARLAAAIRGLQQRLGDYLEVVSWGVIYAYVFFHLTEQLLEHWAGGSVDISQLLGGASGIRTFEIYDELRACAELARHDPELGRRLTSGDSAAVARDFMAGHTDELGDRFAALLARHGHRLVGRDLSCPTWRERPEVVVEILRRLLVSEPGPDRKRRREAGDVLLGQVLERIGGRVTGPLQRELFQLCLRWCREYYAVRENMRYHADQFLAALRSLALEGGRRLADQGALVGPEAVFYATADELLDVLAEAPAAIEPGVLRERTSERIAEYAVFRGESQPEILRGDRAERANERSPMVLQSLRGVGVSPGRAAGLARVVHRVEDLEAVRQGEVIVAASTDPSWASLLSLGGALVLEVGGLLSHGAIIARELGIPAVVDVPGATTLLRTGDRLTVDGVSGQVAVAAG